MPAAENTLFSNLEALLRDLSALVAILSGCSYCLGNSAAVLITRMVVQISFVTQRPPAPSNPQILPVVFASIFALLYHAFGLPSNAGDLHRYEYIHGSILVDFVGERGPVSRLRLIFLDCLILLLQLATLAITFEHGMLQNRKGDSRQDVVAEEQGTRRSEEEGIESQELNQSIEGDSALGSHPSDRFYMDDYTIIELDITNSLRGLARTTPASVAVDPENGAVSSALGSVMARLVHQP